MDSIWENVAPVIGTALATIITFAITWAAAAFQRLTNIQIEAKHQATLHSALLTGASWAAAQYGGNASMQLQQIIDYARRSAPDAVAALKPSDAVLAKLAAAKLEQVTNPNVSPVIG
jgi:hypothetical protein